MPQRILLTLDDYAAALRQHPRLLLFKHSPVCPVSAAAKAEYDAFCAAHQDVPTAFVDVIAQRPVARELAERCGVKHESPQAILFVAGQPQWHAAHDAITAAALRAAWQRA